MKESVGWLRSKIWAFILTSVILGLFVTYWMVPLRGGGNVDFGDHMYPILYNQEYVAFDEELVSLNFFFPVFSPDRPRVNPEKPRSVVRNNRTFLYFDMPGEYYLDINNDKKLKVLVLDYNEEISSNVLRLFDFLVANLVVTQGNDKEFNEDGGQFAMDFFTSKEPKMLLCGPTLSFFEIILRERFNLPARDVTFTGVYMEEGRLNYSTHNVLEVFLPDKGKWVLFDVNNGFVVKWMDAFEITEQVRNASRSKTNITKAEFESIDFDVHYLVDAKRTRDPSDARNIFYPDMITQQSVRDRWHDLSKVYLGGPGYWGGKRFTLNGLSSEYQLYLSRYHQDEFLLEAQVRWQSNWDLKVRHVPPAELKQMLDDAYAEEVSTKSG